MYQGADSQGGDYIEQFGGYEQNTEHKQPSYHMQDYNGADQSAVPSQNALRSSREHLRTSQDLLPSQDRLGNSQGQLSHPGKDNIRSSKERLDENFRSSRERLEEPRTLAMSRDSPNYQDEHELYPSKRIDTPNR